MQIVEYGIDIFKDRDTFCKVRINILLETSIL